MKYNYVTQEITLSKKELDTAFSDIKEFNVLVDNIIYLWLTQACGFTDKEAREFMNRGKQNGI